MSSSWSILLAPQNNTSIRHLLYSSKRNNSWSLLKLRQINASRDYTASAAPAPKAEKKETPPSHPPSKPSQGGDKKGGSTAFKFIGFSVVGFTLGLGLAMVVPDVRHQIEKSIPQSSKLFEILEKLTNGNKKIAKMDDTVPVPEKKPHDFPSLLPPGKTEKPSPEPKKEVAKPATATSKQPTSEEKPAPAAKDLDWKKSINNLEIQEQATLASVELKLRKLNDEMKLRVSEALTSSYAAIEGLNKYRQALRHALDDTNSEDTKDLQWRLVTDLYEAQTKDVADVNLRFNVARRTVEELDKYLVDVKSNELSRNAKNLRDIQVELVKQFRLLQQEQTKLAEAIVHANVLRTYTNEQKQARNQFLKEIQSLKPEGISSASRKSEDELSSEELNSLLIHAHKRVIQLQKQIEKMQGDQNKQIQNALEEQRRQNADLIKKHEEMQNELNRKEFNIEKEKISDAEKIEAKKRLEKELSSQATAHQNHLSQMLRIQQEELSSIFEKQILAEKEKIRDAFYSQVSQAIGRVRGIEAALNARANIEMQANNAKQLWLAVQSLSETISSRAEELTNNPSLPELVEIKTNITKIKESAPDNEFVRTLISSLPDTIVNRGVWSEPDLKQRFYRLKNVCNRVALIDDRSGSLFKYFISYVQSFFIIHKSVDKSKISGESDELLQLDKIKLTTFNILDYAQHYIEEGNFEQALKLMQQLKGEPYRLAQDWIREALILLELKQNCNLLTAYISSIYIGTNFKR